jgi:S1/P1 Nuclease
MQIFRIIPTRQVLDRVNRFALLLLCAAPAFPWGCEGHRTVALVALEQLTPHALAVASNLLQGEPSDPSLRHFCGHSNLPPFADVSTWADDIREKRKETAPWHFIDVPLGAARDHMNDGCPVATGCVTSALRSQLDVLRSESSGSAQKSEALIFLIHFVGDLHQPLHAATNNDRGGNCVPVAFFMQEPKESTSGENFRPNLHGVWDTDLLERIDKEHDPAEFAGKVSSEFRPAMSTWKQQPINLDDWAWESHQLAINTVYGDLPAKIAVETPAPVESCADDNHVAKRLSQLQEKIDERYLANASPVIRQQLAKAGTRLAMLLNQIWP